MTSPVTPTVIGETAVQLQVQLLDTGDIINTGRGVADITDAVTQVGLPTLQGPRGLPNALTVGTVAGGAQAAATLTGTAPNQVLNLTLPRGADSTVPGPAGGLTIADKGTWAASTAYSSGDVVTQGGAYWMSKTSHTSSSTFTGTTNWIRLGAYVTDPVTPTMDPHWKPYDPAYVPPLVRVTGTTATLTGVVKPDAAVTGTSTVCTLPAMARPPLNLILPCISNDTFARINIAPTGVVTLQASQGAGTYLSLNCTYPLT